MISATRYSAAAEIRRQSELGKEIAKLQTSVSSGKRLDVPSDDPAAAARVATIRQTQADQLVWSRNADTGAAVAAAADGKLTSVAAMLDRAKDLVLSARNDTASPEDRAAIASELRGLASDIQGYSEQNDPVGRPLFPTGPALLLPVSDGLSLPATASRDAVFSTTTAAGTQSLSDILNAAADALGQTDPALRGPAIDAGLSAIDAGAAHVAIVRADQGVRAQRFDDAKSRLQSEGDTLTEERSGLEDTDLTYTLSEFQAKQLSLQAAQSLFAQTSKTSLFSLLG